MAKLKPHNLGTSSKPSKIRLETITYLLKYVDNFRIIMFDCGLGFFYSMEMQFRGT